MATEKLFRTSLDVTTGALSLDIGKVVNSLVTLGLTVKNNKLKCEELIDRVQSVAGAINRIEQEIERKGPNSVFDEKAYKYSLEKFLIVVEDCKACVRRYGTKGFLVRLWLSLKFEEDFDSLNKRLDNAAKWFDFDQQVHQTVLLHDTHEGVEELKAKLGEIIALNTDRMTPDDTQLTNVNVGESLIEGYILAGRLDDKFDVILVSTSQKEKEASILKRLTSDSDNILRFYGTFSQGPNKYLVMERPGQTLQTVYDWKMEDHADEWRLKTMMALEIALGLAYAHIAGILHRNLRSANVFLTDDGRPKIFGFFKGRVKSEPSDKKWTDAEQLRWTAPEMLSRDRPQYNEKCDIFSLGVIIWELITGGSPFSEQPSIQHMVAARKKKMTRLHFQGFESDVQFLADFQQVSLDCMKDDPKQRPTIDDVVSRLEQLTPEDMISASLGP
ncbi:hypothetical protein M758_5G027800 [Ceratodon purpureus]|nr:hypothetical protein M758_5G027400 [Ceratodon purpureus]KAG0615269.1 hypothetical protein M758_5G027800 [Ceratodon purpureus]